MQAKIVSTPVLVKSENLRGLFDTLRNEGIQGVKTDDVGDELVKHGEVVEGNKKVILWGKPDEPPLIAVAFFPGGRLSVAMVGSVLLPFNNGQEDGINCALLSNGQDKYGQFGENYETRFTGENPDLIMHQKGFSDVLLYSTDQEVDLHHVALHMISANHDCAGKPSP